MQADARTQGLEIPFLALRDADASALATDIDCLADRFNFAVSDAARKPNELHRLTPQ